ncbi:hypothetical protein GN956_G27034, partial [Arapaima gigas]
KDKGNLQSQSIPAEKNRWIENLEKAEKEGGLAKSHTWPQYISDRLRLYEKLKAESDALLVKRAAESYPITVELPDGKTVQAKAWVTSPYQLGCGIR